MGSFRKKYDVTYKVLVIGESSVGKTALIERYTHPTKPFNPNLMATIGIDYRTDYVTVDQLRVRVQIWDTVGQERFRTMTKTYFRGAKGVLLVYDISNRDTFLKVTEWMQSLKEHDLEKEVIILVGNKTDLEKDRVVEHSEGLGLARGFGMAFYETSAKTGANVAEVFKQLVTNMKDANHPFERPSKDINIDPDWEEIFSPYVTDTSEDKVEPLKTRQRTCCWT